MTIETIVEDYKCPCKSGTYSKKREFYRWLTPPIISYEMNCELCKDSYHILQDVWVETQEYENLNNLHSQYIDKVREAESTAKTKHLDHYVNMMLAGEDGQRIKTVKAAYEKLNPPISISTFRKRFKKDDPQRYFRPCFKFENLRKTLDEMSINDPEIENLIQEAELQLRLYLETRRELVKNGFSSERKSGAVRQG